MNESSSRTSSRRSSRRRGSSAASTSSINSEWETREQFNYVDDNSISEWLICSVCISPFVSPVVSPSCSHTFCYSCIKHALTPQTSNQESRSMRIGSSSDLDLDMNEEETSNPPSICPSCRTPVVLSSFQPAQPIVRHMVDALMVKCPNSRRGCTATSQRQFLHSHVVKDCGYSYIGEYPEEIKSTSEPDSNGTGKKNRKGKARCECGERVMKKDVENHRKAGCTAKWVECEACKEKFRVSDIQPHVETCLRWPIECSHCQKTMVRESISSHEESCPRKIINCPHEKWGCGWTGELQSLSQTASSQGSDQDFHLSSCRFEALAPLLNALSSKFSDLRAENATLRARMNRMEEEREDLFSCIEACQASLGNFLISEDDSDPIVGQTSGRIGSGSDSIPSFSRSQSFPMAASTSAPASTNHFPSDFLSPELNNQAPVPHQGSSRDTWGEFSIASPNSTQVNNRSSTMDINHSRSRRSSSSQGASRPNNNSLSSTLASIQSSINSLNSARVELEKRNHEEHLGFMHTGFEVGRAHEELASLRHGLHAVRMQMHSLLMSQQQRSSGIFGSVPPPNQAVSNQAPLTSPNSNVGQGGLRRLWGMEQTKL